MIEGFSRSHLVDNQIKYLAVGENLYTENRPCDSEPIEI